MKLRTILRDSRSHESLLNHYLVEKELADKLKRARRSERTQLFSVMYDELFSKVPDHPRLICRANREMTDARNHDKLQLIAPFITSKTVAIEFAPGDRAFAHFLCSRVKKMYCVDISDQSAPDSVIPGNCEPIIYDGYRLGLDDAVADVIFSDQLVEHLHPDDVEAHFCLVHRLLKKGGVYVLRTPHAVYGPWDISRFFSDTPQGFHLKEWTYGELSPLICRCGFVSTTQHAWVRGRYRETPVSPLLLSEKLLGIFPPKLRRLFAPLFFLPWQIYIIAHA